MIDNTNAEEKVIYANCGGDGSLMRIIKQFAEEGIDVNDILYATLPFGTANDLPRAFGWGKVPSNRMLTDMAFLMEELLEAEEMHFNVWEICIET